MPTDTQTLRAARPTVEIDGKVVSSLTDGLELLRIHEGLETPATLELEVGNWGTPPAGGSPDFRFLDRREVDFGRKVGVKFGPDLMFEGRITALEAVFPPGESPRLVVLAEDALQALRLARRTRTFEQQSDADVLRTIASDHSLSADVDLPGPTHRVLAQLDQSDLAFARDRVRAVGGELWIEGTKLRVRSRPGRAQGQPLTLALNQQLRELRVRADLAHQASAVVAAGWDVAGKQAIAERADDSVLGAESSGGDTGATILRRVFGDRPQTVVAAMPSTTAEARDRASALFRARARRFVRGEGVCELGGKVRVGRTVTLSGVGAPFSGDYQLVDVIHRFDARNGARSEITVERAVLKASS